MSAAQRRKKRRTKMKCFTRSDTDQYSTSRKRHDMHSTFLQQLRVNPVQYFACWMIILNLKSSIFNPSDRFLCLLSHDQFGCSAREPIMPTSYFLFSIFSLCFSWSKNANLLFSVFNFLSLFQLKRECQPPIFCF